MSNAFATEWTAVLLAAVVGLMAMIAMFIGNLILSPKRASQLKGIPYECGIIPGPYSLAFCMDGKREFCNGDNKR